MFPARKKAYSTATDEQFHKNNSSLTSAFSDISEKKDTSEYKHQHLVDGCFFKEENMPEFWNEVS